MKNTCRGSKQAKKSQKTKKPQKTQRPIWEALLVIILTLGLVYGLDVYSDWIRPLFALRISIPQYEDKLYTDIEREIFFPDLLTDFEKSDAAKSVDSRLFWVSALIVVLWIVLWSYFSKIKAFVFVSVVFLALLLFPSYLQSKIDTEAERDGIRVVWEKGVITKYTGDK